MTLARCLPLALVVLAVFAPRVIAADAPVFELRIYTCEPGKLEALESRFRDHTVKLFEKHGIKDVAYWTPTEGELAGNTLFYILQHPSREQAAQAGKAFQADPEWKAVAEASQKAHGKILAKAPESIYMQATDYSPATGPVDPTKAYELRIYTAAPGKFDALNARFRDNTDRIFKRHGMTAVGYWIPLDKPKSDNTLIYVLQHDSRDAAVANWKAFNADPEWQKAKGESERDGGLLADRPQSTFLQATDFSPRPQTK